MLFREPMLRLLLSSSYSFSSGYAIYLTAFLVTLEPIWRGHSCPCIRRTSRCRLTLGWHLIRLNRPPSQSHTYETSSRQRRVGIEAEGFQPDPCNQSTSKCPQRAEKDIPIHFASTVAALTAHIAASSYAFCASAASRPSCTFSASQLSINSAHFCLMSSTVF